MYSIAVGHRCAGAYSLPEEVAGGGGASLRSSIKPPVPPALGAGICRDRLTEAAVRRCAAYYYASISEIDHHVGRMLALLKSKGLYENTVIVFTSDHGEYLGFHHQLLKSGRMYDPLAKVPLIVKLPANRNAAFSFASWAQAPIYTYEQYSSRQAFSRAAPPLPPE